MVNDLEDRILVYNVAIHNLPWPGIWGMHPARVYCGALQWLWLTSYEHLGNDCWHKGIHVIPIYWRWSTLYDKLHTIGDACLCRFWEPTSQYSTRSEVQPLLLLSPSINFCTFSENLPQKFGLSTCKLSVYPNFCILTIFILHTIPAVTLSKEHRHSHELI